MLPEPDLSSSNRDVATHRLLRVAEVVVFVLIIALPMLRYANLRSNFYDLGQYISILHLTGHSLQPGIALSTHAQLFIPLYGAITRLALNPYSLLVIQSGACIGSYLLFRQALRAEGLRPWVVFALFFSSMPLWFTALNDFHFEHVIWLLYPAFILLLISDRGTPDLTLILAALLMCFVKETYALSAVCMGMMAWFYGHKRAGVIIAILALAYFFIVTALLIPAFTDGLNTGELWGSAFGHLGQTPVDIAQSVVSNPLAILSSSLFAPRKLLFVIVLFLPFLYVLRYAPFAVLPAIPSLLVLALSRNPNHAYLGHHYTVMVAATLFGALVLALRAIPDRALKQRLATLSACTSVVMLVLFSPAPVVSRLFWSEHAWGYQAAAYIPDPRSRQIVQLIEEHVPIDPLQAVSTQGTINHLRIADRAVVLPFPLGVHEPARVFAMVSEQHRPTALPDPLPQKNGPVLAEHRMQYADFVLVDSKRPLTLEDTTCRWSKTVHCTDPEFAARFADLVARMGQSFERIADFDGFAIYRRVAAPR